MDTKNELLLQLEVLIGEAEHQLHELIKVRELVKDHVVICSVLPKK